jgi:hypothetical protein
MLFGQQWILSPWMWLLVVVFVDVAHVYATIFRTYWSKAQRKLYGDVLWVIPLACFVLAVLIHQASAVWFWRLLAYTAVWHFIRQQYGFMRLYMRHESSNRFSRALHACVIYSATIFPMLQWHLQGGKNFHWMIDGDFLLGDGRYVALWPFLEAVYGLLLLIFIIYEIRSIRNGASFNWPKHLVIWGSVSSWYLGIVYFNGDLTFTLLNVIAHGIPYITLIWITDARRMVGIKKPIARALVFISIILVLATLEEGLWDGFVWREHPHFFSWLYPVQSLGDRTWLHLIIPLLALPQLVHYVLDGFIWKMRHISTEEKPHSTNN